MRSKRLLFPVAATGLALAGLSSALLLPAVGGAKSFATTSGTSTSATTSSSTTSTATTTTTTTIALTPDQTTRTIPFGLDRNPKTITLTYSAASALPSGVAIDAILGDLTGSDDVFPASQITTAVAVVGGGLVVKVTAAFDPTRVKTGTYSGHLRLVGDSISSPPVSIRAVLDEHSWWGYLGAFVVILAGVALGLITKWLSDTGSKLGALSARLGDLSLNLASLGKGTVPPGYEVDIVRVRRMIDRGDAASAGPLLDTLTAAEEAVSTLARRLGLLGQVFDEQQQLIDGATGLDADTQTQLSNVVNDERGWPTELLVNAWPNPSSVDADLALKSKRVDSYSQFLHHYAHASAEARAAAPLQPAFDAFTNLDYDAGAAAMTAPAAGSLPQALPLAQPMAFAMLTRAVIHDQNVPAPAPHEAPPQTRRAPTPRHRAQPSFAARLTSIRTLLADNAGLFTAILFGLLVALVGLTELYSNKPSAGQSIADWVGFFAWGFAIELTGITTAQAALRLVPASGSASGTPKSPTP